MQDGSNDPKTDNERGDGSQRVRPTCATCGQKNFGKSLDNTGGFLDCGKDDHKFRNCPTILAM